jgi:hypothetical protein
MDFMTNSNQASILRRVFSLLERIEDQQGSGIVSFQYQESTRGRFVLTEGRLCLVMGMGYPKLGELLVSLYPESKLMMASAIKRAQQEGKKLGETLIELGEPWVTQVRKCLLRQSALGAIEFAKTHLADEAWESRTNVREGWQEAWVPTKGDYDARLTFSLLEVYFEAALLLEGQGQDSATQMYQEFAGQAQLAALFTDGDPWDKASLPLAVAGPGINSLNHLRKLAHAAHQLSHPQTLSAATLRPKMLMLGPRFHETIFIFSPSRVTLLIGSDIAMRARMANRALQMSSHER